MGVWQLGRGTEKYVLGQVVWLLPALAQPPEATLWKGLECLKEL